MVSGRNGTSTHCVQYPVGEEFRLVIGNVTTRSRLMAVKTVLGRVKKSGLATNFHAQVNKCLDLAE